MDIVFHDFGTTNYIQIESVRSISDQKKILGEMQGLCDGLDAMLSAFQDTSEISQINKNAGKKAVAVGDITFKLLKRAQYFSEITEGAFDVTICPAVRLWGIMNKEPQIPSPRSCKEVQKLVDYRLLELDEQKQTAFLKRKGQAIDLGGIAKGYAGDIVKEKLIAQGIESALLNFGGTILTIGHKQDGSEWNVGIQNPLKKRGDMVGTILMHQDVLVTSGVNERFFMKNGKRYHHILDPRKCEPARTGVLSVTTAGGCGMDLDAMATALFVLGVEKGIPLAGRIGIEVLYLLESGEIVSTSGFATGKYRFHMIKGDVNESKRKK